MKNTLSKSVVVILAVLVFMGTASCITVFASQTGGEQPHVHTFGEWTETTPAGCTVDGVETRTCSECGAVETQPIAAAGHTDANGDNRCDTCGNRINDNNIITQIINIVKGIFNFFKELFESIFNGIKSIF